MSAPYRVRAKLPADDASLVPTSDRETTVYMSANLLAPPANEAIVWMPDAGVTFVKRLVTVQPDPSPLQGPLLRFAFWPSNFDAPFRPVSIGIAGEPFTSLWAFLPAAVMIPARRDQQVNVAPNVGTGGDGSGVTPIPVLGPGAFGPALFETKARLIAPSFVTVVSDTAPNDAMIATGSITGAVLPSLGNIPVFTPEIVKSRADFEKNAVSRPISIGLTAALKVPHGPLVDTGLFWLQTFGARWHDLSSRITFFPKNRGTGGQVGCMFTPWLQLAPTLFGIVPSILSHHPSVWTFPKIHICLANIGAIENNLATSVFVSSIFGEFGTSGSLVLADTTSTVTCLEKPHGSGGDQPGGSHLYYEVDTTDQLMCRMGATVPATAPSGEAVWLGSVVWVDWPENGAATPEATAWVSYPQDRKHSENARVFVVDRLGLGQQTLVSGKLNYQQVENSVLGSYTRNAQYEGDPQDLQHAAKEVLNPYVAEGSTMFVTPGNDNRVREEGGGYDGKRGRYGA